MMNRVENLGSFIFSFRFPRKLYGYWFQSFGDLGQRESWLLLFFPWYDV